MMAAGCVGSTPRLEMDPEADHPWGSLVPRKYGRRRSTTRRNESRPTGFALIDEKLGSIRCPASPRGSLGSVADPERRDLRLPVVAERFCHGAVKLSTRRNQRRFLSGADFGERTEGGWIKINSDALW